MQAVRQQTALAESHGLFRAACARQVTWDILWMDVLGLGRQLGRLSNSGVTLRRSFFSTLPKVSQVDIFISHSWHGRAWFKLLTICHCLNLDFAIISCLCICCVAAFTLALHAGSFFSVAEKPQDFLYCRLYLLPMVVFVLAYVGGHLFSKKSFWFDRLCIDQENLLLKSQSLQAMPAFVAHSTRMLVLWDETYFERLWCIYELAVHSKAAGHKASVDVIPTWIPLWTTLWIFLCSAGAFLCIGYVAPRMDTESRLSLFVSVINFRNHSLVMYPILGLIVSSFCFWKMKCHKRMLDQMAGFDLRNAQCTLETDRLVIEEHVLGLWGEEFEPPMSVGGTGAEESGQEEHLLPEITEGIRHVTIYPTKEEIIEQFNSYVRGPLRDNVLESIGKADQISFKLCVVATLPWFCLSLVFIFDCDGHSDCEKAASYAGFSSLSHYIMTNMMFWGCFAQLIVLVEFPLMLSACHWVLKLFPDLHYAVSLRMLLGSCLCACVMYLADCWGFVQHGIFTVAVAKYEPPWLAVAIACGLFDIWFVWYLLLRHTFFSNQQALPSRWLQTRNSRARQ